MWVIESRPAPSCSTPAFPGARNVKSGFKVDGCELREIVVGGGNRMQVDTGFDTVALARVPDVLERR